MSIIYKAEKTLKAIEQAIEKDQGASYRQNLEKVLPHIGDAYRGEDDPFRAHLGASLIGQQCGRAIWYGFRWATKPQFSGRILRLFNRGHLEEARFIAALLTIGVKVYQQDENGKQFRISDFGGHFGGSGDGIAIGIPDLPEGMACLLEFKTHNEKSFIKLLKDGVKSAKFEHYVQMNVYMRKMGLPVALYGAVNKNNDELYFELVPLNGEIADQFIDRGRQIVSLKEAPVRINESPGWFACNWCDHRKVCHLKAAPERNCRTCQFSEAKEDGTWHCGQYDKTISKELQITGCESYKAF